MLAKGVATINYILCNELPLLFFYSAFHRNLSFLGTLGLLDYDSVELNNLHRQILHTEETIGMTKVKSVSQQVKRCVSLLIQNLHLLTRRCSLILTRLVTVFSNSSFCHAVITEGQITPYKSHETF